VAASCLLCGASCRGPAAAGAAAGMATETDGKRVLVGRLQFAHIGLCRFCKVCVLVGYRWIIGELSLAV
jgi:hypothetical protein